MRFLPVKEFRRLDLNSEEMGVPVVALMQNAGKALADEAARMAPEGPVVILCGKGNNGGDGFAAAKRLGSRAHVVVVEPPRSPESKGCLESWTGARHHWAEVSQVPKPALIVDCLLGSGLVSTPRPPYDAAIAWINDQDAPVLACDTPSGLGTPVAVQADVTVTFHAAKEDMDERNSGRIVVADIGIPPAAETDVGFGDLAVGYPRANAASHKGQNGTVLIVGGGPFTGAPYYASVGAYRAGADLVAAFIPAEAAAAVRCYGPEPIVHDAGPGVHLGPESIAAIAAFMPRATALLIGPGLGHHTETLAAVSAILGLAADAQFPTVIDADALQAIPEAYWSANGERTILTPHAREFLGLAREEPTKDSVARFAAKTGAVVVAKGAVDWVASPKRTKACRRGHPTMTVGGTGDVLAGAIAAVLARGATPMDAALAGIYMTNVAGEMAGAELGAGAVALDIADHIPAVLARLE